MPTPDQPLVFIVILNYKTSNITSRCLLTLRRLTYSNYRIVVVDNDSKDKSATELASHFPALTVIQTGSNSGYSGGNNLGIEYAVTQGADYVLIVNPDTVVVNPTFLDELVWYMQKEKGTGIAGTRVFFRDTYNVQNTVLFPPGFWRNVGNWLVYRIAPGRFELSADKVVTSQVLNGVCLLLRVDCLRQAGLFDEHIFMYIEDADMDYRAQQHKWKVQYLPIDSVIHLQKQEGYDMTGEVSFLLKRNSIYYLHKIGKWVDAASIAASFVVLLLIRGLLKFDFVRHWTLGKRLMIASCKIFQGNHDAEFGQPFINPEFKKTASRSPEQF